MSKIWEFQSYEEVNSLDKKRIVFLPIGTIEAHGKHLPVATDSMIANKVTELVSAKCEGIRGPLINFGPCETLTKFPGTITISENTFKLLLKNIISSLIYHGFNKICIINGHGGNITPLEQILVWSKQTYPNLRMMFTNWYEMPTLRELKKVDPTYQGNHADRAETEMMLAIAPQLVKLNSAIDDLPSLPENFEDLKDYSHIMKFAVEGCPSKSRLNTAKKLYKAIINDLIKQIDDFFKT